MSALTAIEAEVTGGTDAGEAGDTGFGRRSSGLQVVLNGAAPGPADARCGLPAPPSRALVRALT